MRDRAFGKEPASRLSTAAASCRKERPHRRDPLRRDTAVVMAEPLPLLSRDCGSAFARRLLPAASRQIVRSAQPTAVATTLRSHRGPLPLRTTRGSAPRFAGQQALHRHEAYRFAGGGERTPVAQCARSERPRRRPCRSDETRAPDERDPLEASVRRGWRESSKRSSASVGAGAPFRNAQARSSVRRAVAGRRYHAFAQASRADRARWQRQRPSVQPEKRRFVRRAGGQVLRSTRTRSLV
jgi:hypothetical protein